MQGCSQIKCSVSHIFSLKLLDELITMQCDLQAQRQQIGSALAARCALSAMLPRAVNACSPIVACCMELCRILTVTESLNSCEKPANDSSSAVGCSANVTLLLLCLTTLKAVLRAKPC